MLKEMLMIIYHVQFSIQESPPPHVFITILTNAIPCS